MTAATVLNVMDRQLLAVLIDPIKQELGVSDAAMGLLTGTSFALLNVGATLPIAICADRGVRRSIIAGGLGLWSGLTLMTGFATTFVGMFFIRVGVGIGEATGGGPIHSLLSDVFPPQRRATALSILVMGGPLGSMIAFAAGGWLGEVYGWRTAFFVFAAPGLLLALLIRATVREPRRGRFEAPAADASVTPPAIPIATSVRFLFEVPALRWMILASGLNSVGLYAVLTWSVPFMTRVHGVGAAEAGGSLALASGLSTALGTVIGGAVVDRLTARDIRWLAWFPAITSALALPFAWGFVFVPDASIGILLLAPASFFAGSYFGPVFSAVQGMAAPQMRALAGASTTASNTLLGLGLAPFVVGWLTDSWEASYGMLAIRNSLALVLTAHLGAALLLFVASRSLAADLSAKQRFGPAGDPQPR